MSNWGGYRRNQTENLTVRFHEMLSTCCPFDLTFGWWQSWRSRIISWSSDDPRSWLPSEGQNHKRTPLSALKHHFHSPLTPSFLHSDTWNLLILLSPGFYLFVTSYLLSFLFLPFFFSSFLSSFVLHYLLLHFFVIFHEMLWTSFHLNLLGLPLDFLWTFIAFKDIMKTRRKRVRLQLTSGGLCNISIHGQIPSSWSWRVYLAIWIDGTLIITSSVMQKNAKNLGGRFAVPLILPMPFLPKCSSFDILNSVRLSWRI